MYNIYIYTHFNICEEALYPKSVLKIFTESTKCIYQIKTEGIKLTQ